MARTNQKAVDAARPANMPRRKRPFSPITYRPLPPPSPPPGPQLPSVIPARRLHPAKLSKTQSPQSVANPNPQIQVFLQTLPLQQIHRPHI